MNVSSSTAGTVLAGSVPVFDDFSASILSTTNWPDATRNETANCSSLDTTGGVAALDVTWLADGNCRYRIVNPTQARTIAADILVSSYSETSGNIRARIMLWAYSTLAEPADIIGDVFAIINVNDFGQNADAGANMGLMTIFMGKCTASGCGNFDTLFSGTLGNIDLDTTRTILISWDGANIITFQADGTEIFVADLTTAAQYANPPGATNPPTEFALRATSGAVGNMSVEFDNFRCATSSGAVCVAP